MKRKLSIIIVFITLFTIVLFTGCSKNKQANTTDEANVMNYQTFVKALEAKGYKVVEPKPEEGETPHTFFSVYAKYIEVDGNRISVYEFKDEKTSKTEASSISKDGFTIGNTMIDWIDTPHFYNKGKLIVCYVGKDEKILKDLESILGIAITKLI